MKSLAELVLSLCDLGEAEGRLLRENVRNIGIGCGIAGIALLFASACIGLLIISAFDSLLAIIPLPLCLLIAAFLCALAAFILFLLAKRWLAPARKR